MGRAVRKNFKGYGWYNGTVVGRWTSHNRTYTGAGAAFNAINDDWSFWCAPETLADIDTLAAQIRSGAKSFLATEYSYLAVFVLALGGTLFGSVFGLLAATLCMGPTFERKDMTAR